MNKIVRALSAVASVAILGGSIMAAAAVPDEPIPAAAFVDAAASMELDVQISPIAEVGSTEEPACPDSFEVGADGYCYSVRPEAVQPAEWYVDPDATAATGSLATVEQAAPAAPASQEGAEAVAEPQELTAPATAPAGQVAASTGLNMSDPDSDTEAFDCRIHGNLFCGVNIEGQTYVIEFSGGAPVGVREGYAPY